jgi:hypothetical protein
MPAVLMQIVCLGSRHLPDGSISLHFQSNVPGRAGERSMCSHVLSHMFARPSPLRKLAVSSPFMAGPTDPRMSVTSISRRETWARQFHIKQNCTKSEMELIQCQDRLRQAAGVLCVQRIPGFFALSLPAWSSLILESIQ